MAPVTTRTTRSGPGGLSRGRTGQLKLLVWPRGEPPSSRQPRSIWELDLVGHWQPRSIWELGSSPSSGQGVSGNWSVVPKWVVVVRGCHSSAKFTPSIAFSFIFGPTSINPVSTGEPGGGGSKPDGLPKLAADSTQGGRGALAHVTLAYGHSADRGAWRWRVHSNSRQEIKRGGVSFYSGRKRSHMTPLLLSYQIHRGCR